MERLSRIVELGLADAFEKSHLGERGIRAVVAPVVLNPCAWVLWSGGGAWLRSGGAFDRPGQREAQGGYGGL